MRLCVLLVSMFLGFSWAQEDCFCVEQIPLTEGKAGPTVLTNAGDGSNRLFYGEQTGIVWVWEQDEDGNWQELPDPFVDLSDFITVGGEEGFLSLSFHPDHKENGLVYMYYSFATEDRFTLLTEVKVEDGNPNKIDITTERELLRIVQPYTNHNGGDIFWADDYEGSDPSKRGNLFIGLGDGGAAGDPFNNAQNPGTLLGKMLRINPLTGVDGAAYGIPEDNPFLDDPDYLPEIYAIGLRNPWRITVDKPTGNVFIGDVGQNRREEIDIMYPSTSSPRKGLNYGWSPYEGSNCFKSALCPEFDDEELEWPIFEYTHEDGRKSVTGGFVYRGCRNPGIVGEYFAADYMQGNMYRLSDNNGTWNDRRVNTCSDCSQRNPNWSSEYFQFVQTFGIDEQGEVYFASNECDLTCQQGYVYRLIDPDTYQEAC